MSTSFLSDPSAVRTAVGKLFAEKPPALVEVRFPKMGTASDWFLCEDAAALDAILDRLGPGAEVHLSSVWDLKNPAGAVVIRKIGVMNRGQPSHVDDPPERPAEVSHSDAR
jgi:hypothetical protein